jgi:hypothetical protein
MASASTLTISRTDSRIFDRRLFAAAAILFPLVIVLGFAPTYYLRPVFAAAPLPSWVLHVHGLLMSAWVLLFVTQVYLISARRVRLHQRLGLSSIGLACLIVMVGLLTALRAAKYGFSPPPLGIPRLRFLVIPFFDLVMFAALFSAAIAYRRTPATHKMLMLLTAINFLPPALARLMLHAPPLQPLGPLWFFGVPTLAALVCVALDTWHHRRVNLVLLGAALLLIASFAGRLALMQTDAWMAVAIWLTSFV